MNKNKEKLLLGGVLTTIGLLSASPQIAKADQLAASHLVASNVTKSQQAAEPAANQQPSTSDDSSSSMPSVPPASNSSSTDNNEPASNANQSDMPPAITHGENEQQKIATKANLISSDINGAHLTYDPDQGVATISGNITADSNDVPRSISQFFLTNKPKKIVIDGPLAIKGSAAGLFSDLNNLEEFEGLSNFDTSQVTSMLSMFANDKNLKSLDLSGFNTSNVTDMSKLFKSCSALTNLDVSSFNTAKVKDMSTMFNLCTSLTNLNLNNFDTKNVENMNSMFYACRNLSSLSISNFNTAKVTDMTAMFGMCFKLSNLNVASFDTSNVKQAVGMFLYCMSLNQLDVSHFNTSNITSTNGMFAECTNLTKIDVSHFKTDKVTDMMEMFLGDSSLTSLDISNFNMNSVTSSDNMLNGLTGLNYLKLGAKNSLSNTGLDTPGIWVNVGDGTTEHPQALKDKRWTSPQLLTNYNPAKDADAYVRYNAAVITHYQDQEGNQLAPNDVQTGGLNTPYTTKPKDITGYTLAETPANASGSFADNTITDVVYLYKKAPTPTKPPVNPVVPSKAANVIVHYQDESGNSLTSDIVLSGNVGDGYTTDTKEFTGYHLKSRPTNATGFFSTQAQDVTYIYAKDSNTPAENVPVNDNHHGKNPTKPQTTNHLRPQAHQSPSKQHLTNNHVAIPKSPTDNQASNKLPQTGKNQTQSLLTVLAGLLSATVAAVSGWFIHKHKEN
ncbi:BspA family leucine-rich repeat surface protein [Lactobacillus sp. M0403]|uniref:BspA family leucine-rich repeat surface protein n=1 Tax=Lactobacillus sp. M0403 TaxID=2751031 RepID=UPI0018DC557F|nr:BspA family leucine-rich repeat surface protein [Lactobacillus sp. M0403]MBI0092561.1 BspA family leucine-rich repeat surface protein [Lactobacillus sp. M0403]